MDRPALHSLPASALAVLRDLLPPERLLTDPADCWSYGYDNSRQQGRPAAVVLPRDHDEVAAIVALCNEQAIPLVARGRGTGTAGATVPVAGGIVLSTERMNRIREIRPGDRYLVAEPGVLNAEIQKAAGEHGFFWAPDPTSAGFASLGGNLACNSAGPRAVKYGTPRDNVFGLRAVTGAGESLRTGVHTSKGVVGYDFTRLLIGSEGTLAIITEATLKLTPLPEAKRTLQALYRDIESASEAVAAVMAQPVTPCALEFIDAQAIAMIRHHAETDLPADAGAMLMIEVDGPAAGLDSAVDRVANAARNPGLLRLTAARDAAEVAALWATRKALSPALRTVAPKKINEDVVVPVSRIPELIRGLERLSREHGITIVNFGHAGNGNIHVNLLFDPADPTQSAAAERCLDAVFDLVLDLRGTLSGEHGIGLVKRAFVSREIDPVTLDLMRRIKREFDPKGILNPGKTLPGI